MVKIIGILFKIIHRIKYQFNRIHSFIIMRNLHNSTVGKDKLKVAFVVQVPEVWDKEAPIFEMMTKDDRFAPVLIVFPSFDIVSWSLQEYGNELDYFVNKYESKYILKAYSDGLWMDVKKEKYDYIFFQRCWENYLPSFMHTKNVSRYAKTCYIPYWIAGFYEEKGYYKTDFFNYMYLCFNSVEDASNAFLNGKFQRMLFLGSPAIDSFIDNYEIKEESRVRSVLWTPRWTSDLKWGGTTFYENMYNVLDMGDRYPELKVIIRPHPLTFSNALREKKLTEKQIIDYKNQLDERGILIDANPVVADTFMATDVLITDYSSIVFEFFLTGKPIIYCSDININFDDTYKAIINSLYVVNSWDEVTKVMDDLVGGKDILKDKRKRIIDKLTSEHKGATKRVLDYLYIDNHN